MIIVTGANGRLGRAIVLQLLERVAAERVGVSVRDVAGAADLAARGVRVRRGDFAEPASLAEAFAGAAQVLIVSSNAAARGGDPLAQHRAAIDAARAAGARRVVYTSHMGASDGSAFPPMRDHAATEAMLAGSGLAWTALRNGFYADSGLMLMGDALVTGVLAAPADGKVAWTAHADLARAAAIVLTDPAPADGPIAWTTHADLAEAAAIAMTSDALDGVTPPLTASAALTLDQLAAIATQVTGKPVRRVVVPDEVYRASLVATGMPAPVAAMLAGIFEASRRGAFATTDPTLARVLGHPPIEMAAALRSRHSPTAT